MKKMSPLKLFFFFSLTYTLWMTPAGAEGPQGNINEKVPEEYTVKKGDTLWDISKHFFLDPFKWPAIWKRNEYILNPDLIYPGNKISLYDLIGRPAKPEKVEKMPVVKAEVPPPPPPKEYKLVSFGENSDLFESAGFIGNQDYAVGHISQSFFEKSYLTKGDKALLEFDNYEPKVGEKFVVYTTLGKVKHPKTGKALGNLIKNLGQVKIVEIDKDARTAVVTKLFDAITVGDKIRKYEEIPIPLIDHSKTPPTKDIKGYTVAIKDLKQFIGTNAEIYIDCGKKDGVKAGDLFEIFREIPKPEKRSEEQSSWDLQEKIGEFRILVARHETSTGWLVNSTMEIGVGESVRYANPSANQ